MILLPPPSVSAEEATFAVEFCASLLESCSANLEHPEPRVRTLVARCIGSHARYGLRLAERAASESGGRAEEEGGGRSRVAVAVDPIRGSG